eukprot:jgi/Ulvmu1/10560/UM065_0014.1
MQDVQDTTGRSQRGRSMTYTSRACPHYKRSCKLLAPCCDEYFWCRHCHNEMKNAPDQGAKRHTLQRHCVRQLMCMACSEEQPVASSCRRCNLQFGAYSCLKCNLFDDNVDKKQFHCDQCGICRTGGAENFFHCDTCGCCYQQGLQENHQCVRNNMHNPCPICSEVLFDSVKEISTLECGHAIHRKCLQQAVHANIPACLVCQRTAEDDAYTMEVVLKAFGATQMAQIPCEDVDGICKNCRSASCIRHTPVGVWCTICERPL